MPPQQPGRLFGGYLRKRYSSSVYMGSWRFCVLQGARLRWYRSKESAETDSQLRGEVWVQAVEPWDGRTALGRYPHAFAVRTTSKRLLLCSAESAREREGWLQHLEQALQRTKSSSSADLINNDDGGRRIMPAPALTDSSTGSLPPPTPCAFPSSLVGDRPAAGSDVTSVMSAPSDLTYGQALAVGDAGCSECCVRFRPLVARRVVCGSCARAFCARHCSNGIRLQHLGLRAARRCCDHCAQRQEFIGYLRSTKRFLGPMASRGISMDALVARTDAAAAARRNQGGDMLARTLHKLRHGPMTLNRTIKILYQTRKKPHLFRVACERLPFYAETCVDRVENLWYQLLHLVQCLDAEPAPRCGAQLFYLQRYIRAICRRSPRIALQTIWHAQASVCDGSYHNLHPHTLLSLLGFIYPNTTSPDSSHMFSIWKDLVFADCPEHQLAQILTDLRQINADMEKLISLEPDSMIERWLNAKNVPQFENCAAELAASGIELCEFQSSILYDSLEVEGSSVSDDTPGAGIESLVLEQVSFVQSLAAISERLRHIQPVSDRGKFLAGELETLNNTLQSSALYPLSAASDELYQVVRIPPTEGKVFSTKMRAPTLIFVETVPVQSAGAIGLDDADTDRLRPFVCSSHPRNSTFFESAVLDEIEASVVSSSGETMLSPCSSSTLATPTPTSTIAVPASCPNDLAPLHGGEPSLNDQEEDSDRGEGRGRHMTLPTSSRQTSAPASSRRHSSMMPHLPQPSRGSKMGAGARAGRRGVENFVYDSKVFGESWEERKARIQSESPMGKLPGWNLFSVIVKTNDDLRQEVFTMQLIHKLKSIFEFEAPHLWLRTYRIVATGANIGLLETITDACSLDHLKKTFAGGKLSEYFRSVYGAPSSPEFIAAQRRFIESMAAYSIVSYVLLLKDRHNGNILLSAEGRVIHIDFGFILGIAPGGMFSVEDAPFKLTKEMVDVMGGLGSPGYKHFRNCLCEGFVVLQKYQSEIAALLQTTGQHSPFPCFHGAKLARVIADMRTRLCVGLSRREIRHRADHLLRKSYNAWGTRQYDSFQLRSNNIHP
ncbi:phosphatidylinositol 3 and 4-kinase-like protein [Phytophthora sojae]|uniref:1-phosphatidylinositol 4-kinase n=1 Tax=Phytophthora sojae (strain P6497) TaxID=1094619 RepID=G4ZA74_PHYSP|nr:phosphatidylinositol 3 and 4-kinase-like protein [Phytophthora sojae]EGZ21959.1 phosphatidylinositol 3 and 4-kinase-like protein [Phytophthora sojae]|eukprot:XP_009524676.1 phosphatidylinositol 3 and 4-kinase-like protein [Phytophthora sojae]